MAQQIQSKREKAIMKSPNFVSIMAILAEMSRCVNQNIAKVRLTPLDHAFTAADDGKPGALSTKPAKA
jgi:hypothetical protein